MARKIGQANRMAVQIVQGEVGGRVALPIWINYMRVALDQVPESPPVLPDGFGNLPRRLRR